MNAISKIKSDLLSLEEKDLIEIRNTINKLLGKSNSNNETDFSDKHLELFWKQLTDFLDDVYPPLSIVFKTNQNLYRILIAANRHIDICIDGLARDQFNNNSIDRRIRSKLYFLYFNMTAKYLIDSEIPVTAKTILLNHGKFLALIDKNFPMYRQSGVFLRVLDSL